MGQQDDALAALRRQVYHLLIVLTVGVTVGRIVAIERVVEPSMFRAEKPGSHHADDPELRTRPWPTQRPEPSPTFSSNDRSRWATVRALVHEGTYVIGRRIPDPASPKGYRDEGIIFNEDYQSVDKVLNPVTGEFFSSKPPLLPTMVAGIYALLHHTLGWDIVRDRWPVTITVLLLVNVLPLIAALLLLARLLEQWDLSDFARLFTFASACGATFLTTFAITLNNHTPAAYTAMFAVYLLLRHDTLSRGQALAVGFGAGLTACLDLPAASFLAATFVWLALIRQLRSRGPWLLIAACVPIAALLVTNVLAIGEVVPAYAKFGSIWYNYDGSHWGKPPELQKGIDFARDPLPVYAFHALFGHHGVFSLTPIWLVSYFGMLMVLGSALRHGAVSAVLKGTSFPPKVGFSRGQLLLHGMTLALSVILLVFYVSRTNNYGGMTSGPRWMFWLTPFLLLTLPNGIDRWARSMVGRGGLLLLLAASVFSATWPFSNPWRHPWIMHWCELMGWIRY